MDKSWFRSLFSSDRSNQPESLKARAENGDAEAQFSVGLEFAQNKTATGDDARAVHWYLRAADQNHAPAQFNLGMLYADGRGVPRDQTAALLWISKAALQGHPGAQHHLGLRHRRASFRNEHLNNALESNLEAFKWFRLAADQGYKGSDVELGMISLVLTREQVGEGNQRVATFIAANAEPVRA